MSCENRKRVDFFVELYNRGLHSIMEDLIMNLDLKSIFACQSVSEDWCNIVHFYMETKNTKFQKLNNVRIGHEWWKKNPVIYKMSLKKFNIDQLQCLHIIGDDNEVLIAANINGTKKAKIILINSKTVVKMILDLTNSDGMELGVLDIKMSLDENFLVAYICEENYSFHQIWNRKDNYSSNYPRKTCLPEQWRKKFGLVDTHLQNIPFLKEGHLCKIFTGIRRDIGLKVTINEQKISDNSKRTSVILTKRQKRNDDIFVQKFGMLSWHLDNEFNFILTCTSLNGSFFDIPVPMFTYPKVIGYSEQYLAIFFYNSVKDIVKIFNANNGTPLLDLYIDPSEEWQNSTFSNEPYSSEFFCNESPNQIQVSTH